MKRGVSIKEQRFFWMAISIMALLIFGLVASSMTIHRLVSRLERTQKEHQKSSAHIHSLAKLYQAASELNVPGNRVFESKKTEIERENLAKALANYDLAKTEVLSLAAGDREYQSLLKDEVVGLGRLSKEMFDDSNLIFKFIDRNQIEAAASKMAQLDTHFLEWRDRYNKLAKGIRQLDEGRSDEDLAYVQKSRDIEVLSVGGVCLVFGLSFLLGFRWLRVAQAHEHRGRLFQELDQLLLTAENSSRLIEDLMHLVSTHLGYEFAAFWQMDSAGAFLTLKKSIIREESLRTFEEESKKMKFQPWSGVPGRVYASRAPYWIHDVTSEKNFSRTLIAEKVGMRSGFGFPIPVGDEIAVMEFYSKSFEKEDRYFLARLKSVGIRIGQTLLKNRIHEELLQAKNLFEQLNFALNSSAIVAITDVSGKILHVNDKFVEISGFRREELLGQDHRILNSGHHSKEFFEDLWKTIGQGKVWRAQVRNKRKEGSYYWVDSTIVPLKNVKGKIHQFVALRYDITDQKAAEEDLVVASTKALDAARAKSEFLANMSHEIRTPLNAIIGMADILSETPLSADQTRYVGIFKRAGDSLLSVINDILDISKIEVGQLRLEKLAFNLRSTLEDSIEMHFSRALEKGIEMNLNYAASFREWYMGDSHRIRQIISNLISNAVKFTHQGSITISARPNESHRKGNILISIQDTGIGIPAHKLGSLFESFTQVDSSVTRRYGGTGLGLSICKNLAQMMGGEVWIESIEGRGTTFFVSLECEGSERVLSDAPEEVSNLKGIRILMIDDREANRLIVKNALVPLGAEVIEAASGEEGFKTIEECRKAERSLHLIIVDNRMPGGMTGIDFVEQAKVKESLKNIPIVVSTSDHWSVNQAEVRVSGAFSFLYKPFKKRELLLEISRSLGIQLSSAQRAPAARQASVGGHIPSLSLLLVDDFEDNRTLFKAYLNGQGHRIEEAENGEIALEKFKSGQFDIVFMDMQMPVLDGYSATAKLREWELGQNKKPSIVVALTAYALKEEQEKSLAAGCNEHLSKPIRKQTLMDALARLSRLIHIAA